MNQTPARVAGSFPWPSILVAIAASIVYIALPSRAYHYDGVADIALRMEMYQDLPFAVLLRTVLPGHLLFDVTALVFWKVALALGYAGRSIDALTPALSVWAGLGIAVFGATCSRLSGNRFFGAICALGLAASGGYWFFADNLEDILFAVVIGLVAFHLAVRTIQDRPDEMRAWVGPGLLTGLAVLAHNTVGVIGLAIAASILLTPGRRVARVIVYSVTSAAAFVLPVTRIGWANGRYHDWASFSDWFLYMEKAGFWGAGPKEPARFAITVGQMLVWKSAVPMALAAVCALGLAAWAAWRFRGDEGSIRPAALLAALVAWVVPTIAFAAWWVYEDPEFVHPALPAFWLLLAAGMRASTRRRLYVTLVAALALFLFLANLFGTAIPDHDPAHVAERRMGDELARRTEPGDLILTPGSEWILMAGYFDRLSMLPVAHVLASSPDGGWGAFEREVTRRIDDAHANGHSVYVHLWPDPSLLEWQAFARIAGGVDGLTSVLNRYEVVTAFPVGGQYFYRLDPPVENGDAAEDVQGEFGSPQVVDPPQRLQKSDETLQVF